MLEKSVLFYIFGSGMGMMQHVCAFYTHGKDETYSHYEDVPLEQILRGKIAFLKLVKGSKIIFICLYILDYVSC